MYNQIIVSGRKVLEDDLTRWFVFCYLCQKGVSDNYINPQDPALTLAISEHSQTHPEISQE